MGRDVELLFYLAVADNNRILVSNNGDLDGVALNALKDVPELSSQFSLGFDDTIITFLRDRDDHRIIYVLAGHSCVTKPKAWSYLEELQTIYRRYKSLKSFEGFKGKLSDMIKKERGKIPPRVDLVVYPDAPRNYLVPKEGDEEPEFCPPPQPSVQAGRKSLQEELAELGDSDDEEPLDFSSSIPPVPLYGSNNRQSKSEVHAPFNFRQVQTSGRPLNWSIEVTSGKGQPPQIWSNMNAKNGPGCKPDESLLIWAKKRGPIGDLPLSVHRDFLNADNGNKDANESAESMENMESMNKRSGGGGEAETFSSRDSPNLEELSKRPHTDGQLGISRKKGSPVGRINYQRSNSKSQEHKVSPEERLPSRESRTDVYKVQDHNGFSSERSKPVAGRISAMAPSGLSWHEEIRRYNVSMGIAAPKPFSGPITSTAEEYVGASSHAVPSEQKMKKPASASSAGRSMEREKERVLSRDRQDIDDHHDHEFGLQPQKNKQGQGDAKSTAAKRNHDSWKKKLRGALHSIIGAFGANPN